MIMVRMPVAIVTVFRVVHLNEGISYLRVSAPNTRMLQHILFKLVHCYVFINTVLNFIK